MGVDLPVSVSRWVRRPLWFGLSALLLAAGLFHADVAAARGDDRTFEDAYRVTAEIDAGWDGGAAVGLSYRHPDTGERINASTYVWQVELPDQGTPSVLIEVARDDPGAVVLAGDRFPATANLTSYAPWVLLPFIIWGFRRFTIHRSVRLVTGPGISFAMQARTLEPNGLRRRWRLLLFPVDVDPDEHGVRPVCIVPLIAAPPTLGPMQVEVKGSPRPFGRVVARAGAGGDEVVLWASGRALRSAKQPPQRDRRARIASDGTHGGDGRAGMLSPVGSALRRAPYAWLLATILVCVAPLRVVWIVVDGTDETSMALTIGATALIAYLVAFALVLAPRRIYSKGTGEQHADEVAALRWTYAIAPVMAGYVGTIAGAEPWTSVAGALASGLLLLLAARAIQT